MKEKLNTLIMLWLSGEANETEIHELKQHAKNDSILNSELNHLEDLWNSEISYQKNLMMNDEFDKLVKRPFHEEPEINRPRVSQVDWNFFLKVAASILILLSVGLALFINNRSIFFNDNVADLQIRKQNPRGQKSRIHLEDGSRIWLNSASNLMYPTTFTEECNRCVQLEGEAYFDVAKNPDMPFLVQVGDFEVMVLGTEFNVNATKEDLLSIALVEGSVKVSWFNEKHEVTTQILTPGEALYINRTTLESNKTAFNKLKETGWKDGILYFDGASFDEVKQVLENWYDVNIIVEGISELDWSYSGVYDNFSLDNVLAAMSFAEEFHYEINGKDIYLKFN